MRSGRVNPAESEGPRPVLCPILQTYSTLLSQRVCPAGAGPQKPRKTRHYIGLPGGGGPPGLRGDCFVYDGGADEVAPFGPGALVIADRVEAEQIFQNK